MSDSAADPYPTPYLDELGEIYDQHPEWHAGYADLVAPRVIQFYWTYFLAPDTDLTRVRESLWDAHLPGVRFLSAQLEQARQGEIDLTRYRADWERHEYAVRQEHLERWRSHVSFDAMVDDALTRYSARLAADDPFGRTIADRLTLSWQNWRGRLIVLSPGLISSVRLVYTEYLQWLRLHPEALSEVHWEAFEKLIAEIFASQGFHVDLTGRLRNRSTDIIAVREEAFGVTTKYLIECKRWSAERRVGLDIVNGVLGAAHRADVDHAFLVTTSSFTEDVRAHRQEFEDLRLHVRDGAAVREWLAEYRPREDGGLWLTSGWDLDARP